MTRLHLVDGTFELFRAHYSKRPPQVTAEGRDVKATVGVMASMLALLADSTEQPTHIAVAFDNPIQSFRNRLFAGYKTEAGVPEELLAQFDLVEEAVRALGVVVWSMDEWEADDALATGAARWSSSIRYRPVLAATLASRMEDALLFRKLATLVLDVPLPETQDQLEWRGVPRDEFLAQCDRLEVNELRNQPSRWR
jgi:5'-3' exonuclease